MNEAARKSVLVPAEYLSTGAIGRALGFSLSGAFIEDALESPPAIRTNTGSYWLPEDLGRIRRRLIIYLMRQI